METIRCRGDIIYETKHRRSEVFFFEVYVQQPSAKYCQRQASVSKRK